MNPGEPSGTIQLMARRLVAATAWVVVASSKELPTSAGSIIDTWRLTAEN